MSRTVQRCRKCRSEKGKAHKPFCAYANNPAPADTTIYITSIESGYSGGSGCSDTSSSSSDSGGGGGCE